MIKILFPFLVLTLFTIPVVDAVPLSDMTGLKFTFPVKTDDRSFTIDVNANSQIQNFHFDKNERSITFDITSSIENNLLEMVIPKSLISGDFRFYLDDTELFPKLNQGKYALLVTIQFSGIGEHKIKLQGTTYLDIFDISEKINYETSTGIIDKIESNPSTNSLIFLLNDTNKNAGQLSIKLSDDVITPFENNEFIVIVDGIDTDYSIEDDMLNIQFNSNSKKITIIGTYVIPEFYEIAPLILASSFIVLIVLRKHKKLFI